MSSYDKHKSQVEEARQSDGKFGSYESGESAATLPTEGPGQPVNAENAIDALSNRFQDDEIPVRRGFASDAEVTYIGIGKYDGLYPVTVDVHKDGRIEVFQHSARTEEGSKLVDSARTDDVSLDDVADMAEAAWRSHPHPETAGDYHDPEPISYVDGVGYEHEEVIDEQGVVDADGDEWAARIEAGDGGFNVYAENLESGKTGEVTHYGDYGSAQGALDDIRNEISAEKQMPTGEEFDGPADDPTYSRAFHIAETQQITGTSKLDPEHAHLKVPVHQVTLGRPDGQSLTLPHQRPSHTWNEDPSVPLTTAEVLAEARNDAQITESYESYQDYAEDVGSGATREEYDTLRSEAQRLREFLGEETYSDFIED